MTSRLFTLFAALVTLTVQAQIQYEGTPWNWPQSAAPEYAYRLSAPDLQLLQVEDEERSQYKEFGYRFGVEHVMDASVTDASPIMDARHATPLQIWQVRIQAPGAQSLNFTFDQFDLPKGAQLFIWDVQGRDFLGAFDHRSNPRGGDFAVGLIQSDDVVIEVQCPVNTPFQPQVHLSEAVYGYRSILPKLEEALRGPFGNSGACNVNVNCPEGEDWQAESRSVGLIVDGGFAVCTGALVNNTAQDGTPYFLTANHCLGGETGWVFYFNHESATCTGNTGPTDESVSGAILRASNSGSDFALLELDEIPPYDYNVQYAGWDRTDDPVASACGIHHPSGDVKKICFEDNDLSQSVWGGADTWRVANWDLGVTEGGSSGSPLFDPNHRIVGQLYGGSAACSGSSDNNQPDYYGRFGVSWDGSSASTRLKDWLDPSGSNPDYLDGWPEGAVIYSVDPSSNGFQNIPETLCDAEPFNPVFRLKNLGTETLTEATLLVTYNGTSAGSVEWEGSLASGASEDISLPQFSPQNGTNTLAVVIQGEGDENMLNNAATATTELSVGVAVIHIAIQTDTYGYETYWELRNPSGEVVLSGGNENVGPNGGGLTDASSDDPGAYSNSALYEFDYTVTEPGCYTFLIVDDYADGICCSYGDGYYTVTDDNGTVLASGGAFNAFAEHVFGMSDAANSVSETANWNPGIYPNPGTGAYTLTSEQPVQSIDIIDALGRIVWSQTTTWQGRISLALNELAPGTYLIALSSGDHVQHLRMVQR